MGMAIWRLVLLCLAVAILVFPSSASAGVLTSEPGVGSSAGRSGSNVVYRATGDPPSRITARSLPGLGLVLIDSRSRIVLAGKASGRECSLQGSHTAICTFVSSVRILGGNHGDVIDARRFTGYATLEGGSGNDVIYAPTRRLSTLSGGLGHNVLVGGTTDETSVSYERALGPVTVDLAKHIGTARREQDRLVGISNVEGSRRYANRLLSGTRGRAGLSGGGSGNYFLARVPSYIEVADERHLPSTVICEHGVTVVDHVEAADLLVGTCAVGQLDLLGSMRTAASAVLSVGAQEAEEQEGFRVARVLLTAVQTGGVVGEVAEPESGAAPATDCYLSSSGRALLRRLNHIRVHIVEFDTTHPLGEGRSAPFVYDTFSTTLTLPRG
jgi:hypothetical protein